MHPVYCIGKKHFYPRPPRGGRRLCPMCGWRRSLFLSTPSARRATDYLIDQAVTYAFLSTPSARRATGTCSRTRQTGLNFYPRPPRGGRQTVDEAANDAQVFLSTPSARRATQPLPDAIAETSLISIHALREEGDLFASGSAVAVQNFYPRPPRGGRPGDGPHPRRSCAFLSTPSARRATQIA